MIAFRTILVAADFSESSRDAFRVAGSLARQDKTRVFVVHVMEPKYAPESPVYVGQQTVQFHPVPRDASEHEPLKERLREFYVPEQPLDVEYRIKEGDAAEQILRSSAKLRCDLIVMGTHGRGGLNRLLAGSIAETVLRNARCPVLALRQRETTRHDKPIRVILHPTDFSECSETSLHVARLLARDVGARLILLRVTPPEVVIEGALAVTGDQHSDRDSLEAIRGRTDGPDLKYPVEVRSGQGGAVVEILRVAREVESDLIVMGTHGRTGLGRVLMGSVAEAVLRSAHCPVLATKVPLAEPALAAGQPARNPKTPR
jgi:nucleotide-binding universal stress UspA family protein